MRRMKSPFGPTYDGVRRALPHCRDPQSLSCGLSCQNTGPECYRRSLSNLAECIRAAEMLSPPPFATGAPAADPLPSPPSSAPRAPRSPPWCRSSPRRILLLRSSGKLPVCRRDFSISLGVIKPGIKNKKKKTFTPEGSVKIPH